MKNIHVLPIEEQKQHIIDIMKADEELGLYEENKKETIEEAAEKYGKQVADKYKNRIDLTYDEQIYLFGGNIVGFKEGAKWKEEQDKKMYSEEDMRGMYDKSCGLIGLELLDDQTENDSRFKEILEQFKKK